MRGIDAELRIVRSERVAPARIERLVDRGRAMAEEVEVKRTRSRRAERRGVRADRVRSEERARQRAEPARARDRDRELLILRARHRRLHDRELDPEQFAKPSRAVHACRLSARARSTRSIAAKARIPALLPERTECLVRRVA